MSDAPQFPPLFSGMPLSGHADPFAKAQMQATLGCDAGLVVYNISDTLLRAAMVFAPDVTLQNALPVTIACGLGFQNALGALAPPEVSIHLEWHGGIRINGASCGQFRIAGSTQHADAHPDWIVVGLELPLRPRDADTPGQRPDQTWLYEEGCVEVAPPNLIGAWARHTLVWINRMESDGLAPLHAEWRGLAQDLGEEVSWNVGGKEEIGTFVGVDEEFGALLRRGNATRLIPLITLLEGKT